MDKTADEIIIKMSCKEVEPFLPVLKSEVKLLIKRLKQDDPDLNIIKESITRVQRELDFIESKLPR